MVRPVSKKTASQLVIEEVVAYIKDQDLRPGDRLPSEHALADMLQVGRPTLREGLKNLEALGLISIRHGEGMFVEDVSLNLFLHPNPYAGLFSLTHEELNDLMDARLLLELETVRRAAEIAGPNTVSSLEATLKSMGEKLDQPKAFVKHDMKFHVLIAEASNNVIYPKLLTGIWDPFQRQQLSTVSLPGAARRAYHFHQDIVQAIRAKDGSAAVSVMREHILDVRSALMQGPDETVGETVAGS